jgi:hypothetical protein
MEILLLVTNEKNRLIYMGGPMRFFALKNRPVTCELLVLLASFRPGPRNNLFRGKYDRGWLINHPRDTPQTCECAPPPTTFKKRPPLELWIHQIYFINRSCPLISRSFASEEITFLVNFVFRTVPRNYANASRVYRVMPKWHVLQWNCVRRAGVNLDIA